MSDGGAPSWVLLAAEPSRAIAEYALFQAARPVLARAPRGDGHPVLVLPGFGADDRSTAVLRRYLRGLGYSVHGWQLGRNVGPTAAIVCHSPWMRGVRTPAGRPAATLTSSIRGSWELTLERGRARWRRATSSAANECCMTRTAPTSSPS